MTLRPLLLAAVLLLPHPGAAMDPDPNAALCESAIAAGARRAGVPPHVLYAIALTETGRKSGGRVRPYPWAINREGKGYWFKTREEALAFGQQSLAEGRRSFDVGCVQINYRWHGHAFPSLEAMFDPEWTATYAGQFLRNLYEERGSWSEAAGAYHSLTPELAQIYRTRFDRLLASLDAGILDGAETLVARGPYREDATLPGSSRAARRMARIEAARAAAQKFRDPDAERPAVVNGSIAALEWQPAAGTLLNHGTPLLSQGRPLFGTEPVRPLFGPGSEAPPVPGPGAGMADGGEMEAAGMVPPGGDAEGGPERGPGEILPLDADGHFP